MYTNIEGFIISHEQASRFFFIILTIHETLQLVIHTYKMHVSRKFLSSTIYLMHLIIEEDTIIVWVSLSEEAYFLFVIFCGPWIEMNNVVHIWEKWLFVVYVCILVGSLLMYNS